MVERLNGIPIADLDAALDRAERVLPALRDGRLFITGGTGFFGRWLLSAIARANLSRGLGLRVTVLTRSRAGFQRSNGELAAHDRFSFLDGDVRDFAAPEGAFSHVIHAATDTSAAANARPLELLDTIVAGTRRVLDFAVSSGARDLLYVSSGAVYGPQGALEHIAETHLGACDPLEIGSVYGESKRFAEQLCAVYRAQHALAPRVARCFAFVGPLLPLDAHFAIGNFIADAVAGRTIRITGDGTAVRSYLYAGDLVAWLLRILIEGTPGRAYNVGSDQGHDLLEVAQLVARVVPSARGIDVQGAQGARSPSTTPQRHRYLPSIERARLELELDAWTPLEQAVAQTASWARSPV
ncbi:MAG TPA: NAD-dependent epimerase/dehydratase family protein [Polyangiales bacterium]|nr:NAD-dependent epimerase/dehydratase family protein [Polyangiales bacterium]